MRIFKYLSASIIALTVVYFTLFYLRLSGVTDEIHAPILGQYQKIEIAQGTEDVAIDRTTGQVFVGADNTLKRLSHPVGKDGIYSFSIDNPTVVRLVSENGPKDIKPHGISFWTDGIEKRLFAINHKSTGEHTVEIYLINTEGLLDHQKTVMFPEMYSPNDVHAVGPESFYATNDRSFNDSAQNKMLSLLGVPFGTAVYYDGKIGRKITGGLSYGNGVNGSTDGSYIYIAESVPKTIGVYARDKVTGELESVRTISLNSAPDNIDIDEDGMLWVAGHESLFKYIKFIKNGTTTPSHVVKVDPVSGVLEDVFYDANGVISGATTGVSYKNKLIISAVHENFVLIVDL